jgi:hypothetical protein
MVVPLLQQSLVPMAHFMEELQSKNASPLYMNDFEILNNFFRNASGPADKLPG